MSEARLDLEKVFDRSGAIARPSYRRLAREVWAGIAFRPSPPGRDGIPDGRGHRVLVVPAFLTADPVTRYLRRFLVACGYRPSGWGLGVNWGPTPGVLAGLRRRLDNLAALEGGPVSVIGVSLGGLLARDLAFDRAGQVRQVITIGTPVSLPTSSTLEPLFRVFAPFYHQASDIDRVTRPLPVPFTSIHTREDGLVAWQSCRTGDAACDIEVAGPHITLCRNPRVLAAVARRLGGVG